MKLTVSATGPEAMLLVRRKNGTQFLRRMSLNAWGNGTATVSLDARSIAWVNVSLVNASSRYTCWRGTVYSCQGVSRDDGRRYTVWARAYRP